MILPITYNPESEIWSTPQTWLEANRAIDRLIHIHQSSLWKAYRQSDEIRIQLETIFILMDALCNRTCPFCPDPCCISATVWYDFKDLIFMHLTDLQMPSAQPIDDFNKTCRYMGPKGCTLTRTIRPWICTWYLCPTQTAILRNNKKNDLKMMGTVIQEIKALRKNLEDEFFRVVTS